MSPLQKKFLVYLSHPIGSGENLGLRHDNIYAAGLWWKFLVAHTKWAVFCPWMAYVTLVADELHGPRALMDQIISLERSDFLIQVGAIVSGHMGIERNHALRNSQTVVDLTCFGALPPQEPDRIAGLLSVMEIELRRNTQIRRVAWLPPLDEADVDSLIVAQRALLKDPDSLNATMVIQRIVQAALKAR